MEILLLLLIVGIVVALARRGEKASRLDLLEGEFVALRESVEQLRAQVAELAELPQRLAITRPEAAPPEEVAAAPVAPAVAAAVKAEVEPAYTDFWVHPGTPASEPAQGAALLAAAWASRGAPASEPASEPAAPAPAEPQPTGPGLVQRALLKLGLAPAVEGESVSRATVEAWLEGRMLAVVGGIALLLGAVFFLSLAFSRGWITVPMRVLIGLGAGVGLLVLGELAFMKLRGIIGHVLVAVGLATVSVALLAATRTYDLVPVEWGLAGAFVAAVAAAVIAVRHDSQLVAAFGLIAVLAAPPILGASPTLVTLMFVAVTLVGTTGVALFRTWIWLPPLAFVLAGPQLASYVLGDAPIVEALIAISGFWVVNTIAAGGEEARHATDRLRPSTVTLLLANAAFTIWAGFTVLGGPEEMWRGTFIAVMAAAHLALGLFFIVRNDDRHPFGLVVAATGVAALTMAVPIQFGGPPVPIAWAAEAVALAWVAVLRRHPYSAAVSMVLGVLALGHLVAIEYEPSDLIGGFDRSIPFAGPEGMTFAFMIAALVVAAVAVPIGWIRAGLAVVGGLVALYVFPFELSGTALVGGWAALAVVAAGLYARVVAPRIAIDFTETRLGTLALPAAIAAPVAGIVGFVSRMARPSVVAIAVLAGIAVLGHLGSLDYPANVILDGRPQEIPFVGLPGLAFAIVLAALVVAGLLVRVAWVRVALAAVGGLVALYVFPFELSGPALVWAWAALATAAFVVDARVIEPRVGAHFPGDSLAWIVRPAVRAVGALVGAAILGHLLSFDFRLVRLGDQILSATPYAGPEGLSLAAALAALAAVGWVLRERWIRLGMVGIGLALLAYTVTFEIGRPHVTIAWGLVAVASLAVVRRVALVEPFEFGRRPILELIAERLPYAAADLALLFLVVQAHWYATVVGFVRHVGGSLEVSGTPFTDTRTFALAVLAATLFASGWTWGRMTARLAGWVAAAFVVAWLLPFEIRTGYAVAGWSALVLLGLRVMRLDPAGRVLVGLPVIGLAVFGAAVALLIVAPPDRLVVDESSVVLGLPFLTDATVALGGLAIAVGVGAYLHRAELLSRPAIIAAGVIAVYLLSVGVVDIFQRQVGARPLEELQKEGQVGLSVLWSVLGGIGFATGLRTHRPPIRLSGLALLGIATVKVFLVDLTFLDVAYRVLSLVALGVLLLLSAMVYSRMQHPHPPTSPKPA
jgi:hypothetical protein